MHVERHVARSIACSAPRLLARDPAPCKPPNAAREPLGSQSGTAPVAHSRTSVLLPIPSNLRLRSNRCFTLCT
eukprot:3853261-Prymnesium_polylepis.1